MKVLLHICCAPCLLFPLARLREAGHEVQGLFFNPNIAPAEEFDRRLAAVRQLCAERGLSLRVVPRDPAVFEEAVGSRPQAPERCAACWKLRLEESATAAALCGCAAFTTTLLVSPYQDRERILNIGEDAARRAGVLFGGEDFRPGFRAAHEEARARGIYCQHYCGCSFSLEERQIRRREKRQ